MYKLTKEAIIVIAATLIIIGAWSIFSVNKEEYQQETFVVEGVVSYKTINGNVGGSGPSLTVLKIHPNFEAALSSSLYYGSLVNAEVAEDFNYLFDNQSLYVTQNQVKELNSRFNDLSYFINILNPEEGETIPFRIESSMFNEIDVGSWVRLEVKEVGNIDSIIEVKKVFIPGRWMHYPTKIVYTIDTTRSHTSYEADCNEIGGIFNSCGTTCPEDAEFCVMTCAFTCENLTGDHTPLMKGYEVYAWLDDGQWYFSLHSGTNRIKSYSEIKYLQPILNDKDALINELSRLSPGEHITFSQYKFVQKVPGEPELSLPPRRTMGEIFEICEEKKLNCVV